MMDILVLITLTLAGAIIAGAMAAIIRSNGIQQVGDHARVFRTPVWAQIIVLISGPLVAGALAAPLFFGWQRGMDMQTAIFLSLVAIAWPIAFALGAIEIIRSYVSIAGTTLKIRRWRRVKEVNLRDMSDVTGFRFASALVMRDGSLILMPGVIGLNVKLQREIRLHAKATSTRKVG